MPTLAEELSPEAAEELARVSGAEVEELVGVASKSEEVADVRVEALEDTEPVADGAPPSVMVSKPKAVELAGPVLLRLALADVTPVAEEAPMS